EGKVRGNSPSASTKKLNREGDADGVTGVETVNCGDFDPSSSSSSSRLCQSTFNLHRRFHILSFLYINQPLLGLSFLTSQVANEYTCIIADKSFLALPIVAAPSLPHGYLLGSN